MLRGERALIGRGESFFVRTMHRIGTKNPIAVGSRKGHGPVKPAYKTARGAMYIGDSGLLLRLRH